MFISNLSIENWISNRDEGEFIENSNWDRIEAAIRNLNGKSQTLVTLGAAKLFVDLQTALLAAKKFAELGQLEQSVSWEENKPLVVL